MLFFSSRSILDRSPAGAVCPDTKIRIGLRTTSSDGAKAVSVIVRSDESGSETEYPLIKVWSENGFDRFEGDFVSGAPGLYWYYFSVDGQAHEARHQLTVYDKDYNTPEWIKTGAYYHIFVDRFNRGGNLSVREGARLHGDWYETPDWKPDSEGKIRNNDFFGGDLEGIIQKLPYLAELGITCLYLSPIFDSPSNHKYDTSDYMTIDPSFGDDETFARLCSEANLRGIHIILDGVFNHTGDDSIYFNKYSRYGQSGAYNSPESPYYNWYYFHEWPDSYESWWNFTTLPKVNAENPEYKEYILGSKGVLQKWMALGADGWRLDVADELPESFLRDLRSSVKSFGEDKLIIGEVWEDASNKIAYGKRRHYFNGYELDSVMNYPLKDAIIIFIMTSNSGALRETVESLCENYPKPALDCAMNVLGTHDTARILSVLYSQAPESREERAESYLDIERYYIARERLFVATLLQFTLPGVPCIFYGDEAGMQGWEDPFCRRCFPWGNEDDRITDWYRALLKLRSSCPALAGGEYRTITAEDGVFVFERECDAQFLTVAVNLGNSPIPLPKGRILMSRSLEDDQLRHNGFAVISE